MRTFLALIVSAGLASAADATTRLESASEALQGIMGIPDKTIPQQLLAKAECIIIVPDLLKGGFIIGGKYGKGFASCRKPGGAGWSAPGAVRVEGGSFGLQIGAAATDVIMLVMNTTGMNRLLTTKFTLGGEASAAAGPVGRSAQADTDAAMTAEILTWSRQKGLFAGIVLNGATLREDADWNLEMYGKKLTNREILAGTIAAPKAAASLLTELNRFSSRK